MKIPQDIISLFESYIMEHIDEDIIMIPLDWIYRNCSYPRNDIIFYFFMYYYSVGCDVFMDIDERYLIYAV